MGKYYNNKMIKNILGIFSVSINFTNASTSNRLNKIEGDKHKNDGFKPKLNLKIRKPSGQNVKSLIDHFEMLNEGAKTEKKPLISQDELKKKKKNPFFPQKKKKKKKKKKKS